VSRPLGSTATPASSGFSATTGRSAGERRVGTQCLRFLPRHAPFATLRAYDPGRSIDARLLTFRARAADQAHAASTPGTAWPATRVSARLIPEGKSGPPVLMPSESLSTPQQRTPHRESGRTLSGTSSWSPPDAVKPRLFPGRSPRQSSANAARGGLTPAPAGPTPEGHKASISRTAPPM